MEQEQKTYKIDGIDNGCLYFDYLPCLNYSMQHNHYNSLIACNLLNDGEISWKNVEITIEGDMLVTSTVHIDIVPPETHIEIKNLAINVNPSLLIELTEGIDSKFRLTFNMNGESLFTKEFSIELMAYDQWTGISINPELLASFVTPNCSLLAKVSGAASNFLEQWTGSSSLDEYQSQNPN